MSTAIKNESERTTGRHRVDLGGVSTANSKAKASLSAAVSHQRGIAVYVQQPKPQAEALPNDTVVSTRAVYQPRQLYINNNQN